MVVIALAAKAGVSNETWTVAKTPIRFVHAPMAALWVIVSNERPKLSVSPIPRHFATGKMNSMPASSAIWLTRMMSSQSAGHRSGAALNVRPPPQLALNRPNLNALFPK